LRRRRGEAHAVGGSRRHELVVRRHGDGVDVLLVRRLQWRTPPQRRAVPTPWSVRRRSLHAVLLIDCLLARPTAARQGAAGVWSKKGKKRKKKRSIVAAPRGFLLPEGTPKGAAAGELSRLACAEQTFFSFFDFDGPSALPSDLADNRSVGIAHRLSVKSLAPVMMKTRPPLRRDASPWPSPA
jgi:hypothetical protein